MHESIREKIVDITRTKIYVKNAVLRDFER